MRWIEALGIVLFLAVGPAWADGVNHTVTCSTNSGEETCAVDIRIDGKIDDSTLAGLRAAFAARDQMMANKGEQNDWLSIRINSGGGDVKTAMEIGKLLRAKDAPIEIAADELCGSACVFILAGATHRKVFGRVGIHRPYLKELPSELSLADVQKRYTYTAELMRSYFRFMNVSDQLADAIMLVPPEQAYFLSPYELVAFGLGASDPASDEFADLEMAKKLGIDPPIYFQRKRLSASVCAVSKPVPGYAGYGACVEAVLSGKRVEQAPPCRNRAPTCLPKDRDWQGRTLSQFDQVTPNGYLITDKD